MRENMTHCTQINKASKRPNNKHVCKLMTTTLKQAGIDLTAEQAEKQTTSRHTTLEVKKGSMVCFLRSNMFCKITHKEEK